MNQPQQIEKCVVCGDIFGEHFTSYNGKLSGCGTRRVTNYIGPTDMDTGLCNCKGFAVRYTPPAAPKPYFGEPYEQK